MPYLHGLARGIVGLHTIDDGSLDFTNLRVCIIFFSQSSLLPCQVDALTTTRGTEGGHVVERLLNQVMNC